MCPGAVVAPRRPQHTFAALLPLRSLIFAACQAPASHSLLLTSCTRILLLLARDNLSKHHDTVSVHECYTRKPFTVFKAVAHQWLLRLECTFCHLVRLQG